MNQYGLTFDGADEYININTILTPLKTTTTGTWSMWVKPIDASLANKALLAFANGDGTDIINMIVGTPATLRVVALNDGVTQWDLGATVNPFSNGVWTHIAVVQDGVSPVLYVNGVAVAQTFSTSTDKTIWFNNLVMNNGRIAARFYSAGEGDGALPFNGNIDEVAFFNTNLTVTQVAEIYNSGKPTNLRSHSKSANLVAYYRIGDPTAIHDGTNWQIPDSKTGLENKKSVLLDGVNEYVNIDNVKTALASTTVGTFSVWVKPVDATPTENKRIISFGDTNANEYIDFYNSTTGLLGAVVVDAGVIAWDLDTDAEAFSDNTWTHVALVQNGVSPILYVNGTAVAQTFTTSTDKTKWFSALTGLDNGRIGNLSFNNLGEVRFYNGNIDEVRFYNAALTAAQITALYNLGSPAEAIAPLTDANLVAHYRMGDAPLDTNVVIKDVHGTYDGVGVNLEPADLEYDSPLLGVSVNMESLDLITGVGLT